jgi:hypothetical protein
MNVTGQNISTFCVLALGALRSYNNNLAFIQAGNNELCEGLEKLFLSLL